MTENKEKISRKEYFRQYYLKNKENRKIDDKTENGKKKRGRPRKVIPPFSITKLDKPITIRFE